MKIISKKKIIGCTAILVLISAGLLSIKPIKIFINNRNALEENQYTILKKGKSINYIEAKGKVDSLYDSIGVYADADNQMYKIEKINVQVGDKVAKGDIVATIDDSDILNQISELKEKLNTTKANKAINLKSKEQAYNNLIDKNENNIDALIIESEKNLNAAKIDMDEKNRVYEQNKILEQSGAITAEQLIQSKNALDISINTYNSASYALESRKKDNENALIQAKNDLDYARAANDDKSGEIEINIKEKQLEDCKIKAPADGTIININVKEGTPAGLAQLFEIKDLDNLIIKADVKEHDIADVKQGQNVEIKSDSVEDEILQGTVISIEPAAEKEAENPLEVNEDPDDAEFIVKIQFNKYDNRIMAGMNTNVNIVIDEKDDTYKVPCSCIFKENDDYSVYVAQKEDNKYIVKKITVTKGIESDTEVEIIGQDIEDNMIILNTPTDYYEGQEINMMMNY